MWSTLKCGHRNVISVNTALQLYNKCLVLHVLNKTLCNNFSPFCNFQANKRMTVQFLIADRTAAQVTPCLNVWWEYSAWYYFGLYHSCAAKYGALSHTHTWITFTLYGKNHKKGDSPFFMPMSTRIATCWFDIRYASCRSRGTPTKKANIMNIQLVFDLRWFEAGTF